MLVLSLMSEFVISWGICGGPRRNIRRALPIWPSVVRWWCGPGLTARQGLTPLCCSYTAPLKDIESESFMHVLMHLMQIRNSWRVHLGGKKYSAESALCTDSFQLSKRSEDFFRCISSAATEFLIYTKEILEYLSLVIWLDFEFWKFRVGNV